MFCFICQYFEFTIPVKGAAAYQLVYGGLFRRLLRNVNAQKDFQVKLKMNWKDFSVIF